MEEYTLPLLMVTALVLGIFSGYPVAFVLAGVGVTFTFMAGIPTLFLGTVVSRIFTGVIANWLLMAVPLFIFMGLMLERAGTARRLLLSLERLFSGVRGGLAVAVALLGVIMAASTGIIGASVVMLGVMALPVFIKQGYDKRLAAGTVAASGTLGILIPPSIMLVLVGDLLQISVGDLFLAAIFPGLILGGLYVVYILGVAFFQPHKAPVGERDSTLTGVALALEVTRDLVAPVMLIIGVLGSIMAGVATPTEAAAIGAAGSLILAAMAREISWLSVRETAEDTTKTTAMILFIAIGATTFSAVFKHVGGDLMIEDMVAAMVVGPYATLGLLLVFIFILGFFLEWIEISYIVLPLFAPIVAQLDFGLGLTAPQTLMWFAILVAVNLQTSFLTPPFGYALFYLKGIAPPEITMSIIYRAIIPFVILQLIGLGIAVMFPQVVLWLPNALSPM